MKKAFVLFLTAMVFVCGLTLAHAEQISSPVAPEVLAHSINTAGENKEGFVIEVLSIEETSSEDILALYKNIQAAIDNNEEFFSQQELDAAGAVLPKEVMPSDMLIAEFIPLRIVGYEEIMGDIEVSFFVPGTYVADDVLLGLFASPKNETYLWNALKTVAENNDVRVTFTCEALMNMNGSEAVLLILRNN